jgi:flavodoxin
MKRLLIVWHSHTGGSRQMAEAAAGAARGEDGV